MEIKGKILYFLWLISVIVYFSFIHVSESGVPLKQNILIIYSSGMPSKTISDMEPKEIDTITGATPLAENCKTISERIAAKLREKGLSVHLIEATQFKNRDEILTANVIIIGSPVRFWNVSWEIKKIFDEKFGEIYVLGKTSNGLANHRIAAFAMAETESSARDALEAISKVIKDCKGKLGATEIFLTKHSRKEVEKRITKFSSQICALLNF